MLSGPVGVGFVGTGLEIPAVSAGKEMKPHVEGHAESCKTDQGANQGWVNSSEGEVWKCVVGCGSGPMPG